MTSYSIVFAYHAGHWKCINWKTEHRLESNRIKAVQCWTYKNYCKCGYSASDTHVCMVIRVLCWFPNNNNNNNRPSKICEFDQTDLNGWLGKAFQSRLPSLLCWRSSQQHCWQEYLDDSHLQRTEQVTGFICQRNPLWHDNHQMPWTSCASCAP